MEWAHVLGQQTKLNEGPAAAVGKCVVCFDYLMAIVPVLPMKTGLFIMMSTTQPLRRLDFCRRHEYVVIRVMLTQTDMSNF